MYGKVRHPSIIKELDIGKLHWSYTWCILLWQERQELSNSVIGSCGDWLHRLTSHTFMNNRHDSFCLFLFSRESCFKVTNNGRHRTEEHHLEVSNIFDILFYIFYFLSNPMPTAVKLKIEIEQWRERLGCRYPLQLMLGLWLLIC